MKKWTPFISGAALAFSLSACGQTAQPEAGGEASKEASGGFTAEEVYVKSQEAAEEADSLHADILTDQHMKMQPEGMEIDVAIDANMDIIRNPEAFHHQSETSIRSDDIQNETPASMEMYFTEEGLYMYEAPLDMWLKLQDEAVGDFKLLADQQSADPAHQLKELGAFAKDFALEETGEEYILRLESSGEEFYPLMVEQLKKTFGQMEIGTPMNSEGMNIRSSRYEFRLDKNSFRVKNLKMDADLEVEIDEETMSVQSSVEAVYSKYDEIGEITLPDKVTEQAQILE
ncbi:DUF6612 family protein [Planomicrobium sp. CPCC 101110]|uniref:DUF6612 family protein n=1 Tax=Planomicrobium sp. CPCC 101110 TaxID=2599619 RepID=UPI0011B52F6C|nr:DUF6612 family protein [Planomicrobium sp. CPCC 101110]TWT24688.1 hypothetical protein FQV30_14400 [Planomicrobium sp. CPCC 101110]